MEIQFFKWKEMSVADKTRIMQRSETDIHALTEIVQPIIDDVRQNGDEALIRYAEKFDGAKITGSLKATEADFVKARKNLDPRVIQAIEHCAGNVRKFHKIQKDKVESHWIVEIEPGVFGGEQIAPIPSVGIYVPRGKGAFPSVMYMLCTPAVVANVPQVAACTPPTPDGGFDDASLVAAEICGVKNVYKAGGAQAVAALAFGTQTIPKVHKIVGPGSPYVAAARRLLSDHLEPGMPAGPSESLILADEFAHPYNTALDMLNEAEHGPDSASILVTHSEKLALEVKKFLPALIQELPEKRREFCINVFKQYGGIILTESMEESISFANEYAVEHLLLKVQEPHRIAPLIVNAGEILIGEWTPIVLGNFGIGVNAILPTGRHANVFSTTSIWDFLKRTSLAFVDQKGYSRLQEDVLTLADYEGFPAHVAALRKRDTQIFSKLPAFENISYSLKEQE